MLTKLKRLFKHRWHGDSLVEQTLPVEALQRLTQRIKDSEQLHSGEIRVVVEAALPLSYLWRDEPLKHITRMRALSLFGKARVWDTAHNNGVLIYLLLSERVIEIVADRGLNDKINPPVWEAMVDTMRGAFQRGEFEAGLTLTISEISKLLVTHFALAPGQSNPNELADAIWIR